MDNCIFCKIINKEIASKIIYENSSVLAFLDIAKDVYGHTLVIPKKHVKNILDCDEETLNDVVGAVKLISNYYINDCGFDGINILNANEGAAEQSVFHLHFHIIPRKNGDNIKAWPFHDQLEMDLDDIYNKLKIKNAE